MIARPARLLLALGILGSLSLGAQKPMPEQDQIAKKIDEITQSADYEWLREEEISKEAAEGSQAGTARAKARSRYLQNDPQSGGCGYRMGPPIEKKPAKRQSCNNDTPGSCENNSIGDCGFHPQAPSCGDFSIGSSQTIFGYILGILLLIFLLYFVIWSVKRAEGSTGIKKLKSPQGIREPDKPSLREAVVIPPIELLQRAKDAAGRADYKTAVGRAYLASLGMLHQAGKVNLISSTTNYEIVQTVKRNGGPHLATEKVIGVFEEVFFGGRKPTAVHWDLCLSLIEDHFVRL